MIEKIRSVLFAVFFYVITLILFIIMLPTMFMTRKGALFFPIFWTKMATVMLRVFCGIKIRVEGLENLPKKNGYIVASKHQSALETTLFHRLVPYTFYVLKKELCPWPDFIL